MRDFRVNSCSSQEVDRQEWEDLVDRTPISPGLSQRFDSSLLDEQEGLRSRFVTVRSREGLLVGGVRLTLAPRTPSRYLEMAGGPLFVPGYEDEVSALVAKMVRQSVRVIDGGLIRPSPGHAWHLERFGLRPARDRRETIIVDLSRTEEEVWRGVDHSVRQGVRKAKDHGLTVREMATAEEIDRIYPLIERFGRLRDFVVISKPRLVATQRLFHPAGRSHILVCDAGSEPAAVAVILLTNQRAELLVVASSPDFAKLQAISLLDWEAMRFCKSRGATMFDFLGLPPVGSGLDGLRRFKLKWGGSVVGREEYLEGVLFRFATEKLRHPSGLLGPFLRWRGPFRVGA